jgi:hypothetical protein
MQTQSQTVNRSVIPYLKIDYYSIDWEWHLVAMGLILSCSQMLFGLRELLTILRYFELGFEAWGFPYYILWWQ